jgi:2-isopropylmalate synthase
MSIRIAVARGRFLTGHPAARLQSSPRKIDPALRAGAPNPTLLELDRDALIYDWNTSQVRTRIAPDTVQFDDETLRDGLQSPSVRDPDLDQKLALVRLMDRLGIHTANVGLPGAGERAREHIQALCLEMKGLRITPNVACRTLESDIAPIVDLVQRTGRPVEVCAFIGSSPIRQYAEGWDIDRLVDLARKAVEFCVENDLPCMFVTEDTTRARPSDVRALYTAAIDAGAKRLCICDTCGHATPDGVRALVGHVRDLVRGLGVEVGIDWHGHRDRGLGLVNALTAIEAGATRIHGTALGVGERAGNAEMDLLLVNLKLAGLITNDLSSLAEYVRLASAATGVPIPHNYAVFGSDAFETGTGVHAAAVVKAFKKGDAWLADRVYSGVPAGMFGLEQEIRVGPMSGRSNVTWVLEKHGVEPTEERVKRVLGLAKQTPRMLTTEEVLAAAR